ncbi:MAG: four helix bundle protein [Microcystaceae cyanobacterium]
MSSLVYDTAYPLAIPIINTDKLMSENNQEWVWSKQLLKSVKSMLRISKTDFRAKMSITAQKYLETKYWLSLLKDTKYITAQAFVSIYQDGEDIRQMLWQILATTQKPRDR